MDAVSALAELVRSRRPVVALTGAGVSTESGIPDFRSATGIWAEVDPAEVATIEAFRRDPDAVWSFYAQRFRALADAEPNAAHHALAELERRGVLHAVITQNIDTLHTRAGSDDVIEVHGSIRDAVCPRCGATEPLAEAMAHAEATGRAPTCAACGAVLRPGVVLFGELLPKAAIDRATALARQAALMLVVGSSLEVWPVAGLPLESRAFAIVNRGATPLDARAALTIDAGAGETLAALVDAL
jgi:NAD-dependent deacetylase